MAKKTKDKEPLNAGHSIIPQVRYPAQFPMAEITSVSEYLRGLDHAPDAACALECAWNVVGFGCSFVKHDHPPIIGKSASVEAAALSDEALAAKLDELTLPRAGMDDIPWNIIVPFALQALQRILDRWLNS